MAWVKGRTERQATLNQALLRGLPPYYMVLGGSEHFSVYLPLLVIVNNLSSMNPSLDSACDGEGLTPWISFQGTVEVSTQGGLDTNLLATS